MSREEMIKALEEMGFDVNKINDGIPDEFLADLVSKLQDAGNGDEEEAPPAEDAEGTAQGGERSGEVPEGMPEEPHVDLGEGTAEGGERPGELPEGAPEDQHVDLAEDEAGNNDEPAGDGNHDQAVHDMLMGFGCKPEDLEKMSDEDKADLLMQHLEAEDGNEEHPADKDEIAMHAEFFSEARAMIASIPDLVDQAVQARLAQTNDALKSTQHMADRLEKDTRWKSIESFCEKLRDEGRILPREFTNTVARLKRADNLNRIAQFDEKGTKTGSKTELELQMEEIEQRPILRKFGERIDGGKDGDPDPEVKKLEHHYEQFSERYAKLNTDKDKFVNAFKSARKKDPTMTADQFTSV